MKTISAKINDREYAQVEELSRQRSERKSDIVREAITAYCQKENERKKKVDEALAQAFGAWADDPLDATSLRGELDGRLL